MNILRDGRPGWYRIYNDVLDEYGAQMKPHGLAVYNALCRFSNANGVAFPGHGTIAKLTGMSRRQVIREMKKLCDLGLIDQAERNNDGMKRSNIYTIKDIARCDGESRPDVTESHNPSDGKSHRTRPIEEDTVEEETTTATDPVWDAWLANMPGVKTPMIVEDVEALRTEYSDAEIVEAIKIACKRNKRNLGYVEGILRRGVDLNGTGPDEKELVTIKRGGQDEW